MPYTLPTANDLRNRFPAFEDVGEGAATYAIQEASGRVSTSWIESDYQPAILYYAAHLLTVEKAEISADAEGGEDEFPLKSIGIGPIKLEYAIPTVDEKKQYGLDATIYGRRFREIMKRNSPGILVV